MAIFLNKKNLKMLSKENFLVKLFSRLSPRWYPVNVISSSVHAVLDAYALQFSSASAENVQVYKDGFLSEIRTGNSQNHSSPRMFEVFGANLNSQKLALQNFDTFSTGSVLTGYRNQLRLLGDAYFSGVSREALKRVGQAFSGMAPSFTELIKNYYGWKLVYVEGSILEKGDGFYILDTPIPPYTTMVNSSEVDVVGSSFSYTKTKLGVNTKLFSKQHAFSGLDALIYGSGSIPVFKDEIAEALKGVSRADQYPVMNYSDVFAYYRPGEHYEIFSTGSAGRVQLYQDYIHNIGLTPITVVTGSVIKLPNNYENYDWCADWVVRTYNDASYKMMLRGYNSENIPESIYFEEISDESIIEYLPSNTGGYSLFMTTEADSSHLNFGVIPQSDHEMAINYDLLYTAIGAAGSHYVVTDSHRLDDISGNGASLKRVAAFGTGSVMRRGRHADQITPFKIANSQQMYYSGSTGGMQNFYGSFYFEFWARGIDNTFIHSGLQFKRQSTQDALYDIATISGVGWCTYIDASGFNMLLQESLSSSTAVNTPISDILAEEPSHWHYFAGTYCSGSVYLYVDGIKRAEINAPPVDIDTPESYTSFVIEGECYAGLDEFVIVPGFLSPDVAKEHFEMSKPRLSRSVTFLSGSVPQYVQPLLVMQTQGSKEIEWHEFSMRAVPRL